MDIKVIINSLLIIILLHLLIRNIKYNKTFELYKEQFIPNITVKNNDRSLDFLLDINEDNHYQKKLDTYINTCNKINIKPANYYQESENIPNFKSNVLNINDFFKSNKFIGSYDNLTSDQLTKLQPVLTNNDKKLLDPVNNAFDQFPKYQMTNNNEWKYKNDLHMNGQKIFDNVYGYDNFNSNYSSYNDEPINSYKNDINKFKKPDDIRMGLGYPNQINRNTT